MKEGIQTFRYPIESIECFYERINNIALQFGHNDVDVIEKEDGSVVLSFFYDENKEWKKQQIEGGR